MEVGIFFFQNVIFAPKTFSFMTNFLGYIPMDHCYISMKIHPKPRNTL